MKRIAVLLAVALVSLLAAVAVAGLPSSVPDDVVITDRPSPSTTAPTTAVTTPPADTSTTSVPPSTTASPSTDPPTSADSTDPATTLPASSSFAPTTPAPTTTSTLVAPAGLRVVVVNGTRQPLLGAQNASLLNSLGYVNTIPTDAIDKDELTSDVLFADGFRAEAETLAGAVQIDPANVAPMPEEPVTVEVVDGDLWLVLGADRVP